MLQAQDIARSWPAAAPVPYRLDQPAHPAPVRRPARPAAGGHRSL